MTIITKVIDSVLISALPLVFAEPDLVGNVWFWDDGTELLWDDGSNIDLDT